MRMKDIIRARTKPFLSSRIVPDIIPHIPKSLVKIVWKDSTVSLGSIIMSKQMRDQPTLSWETEENSYYTIIFVDPDAPTKQNAVARDVLHWLVVNVPGCEVSKGEIKTEYVGSSAPKGSGLHRYVFLICKQDKKKEFEFGFISKNSLCPRIKFNTSKFLQDNSLELVAANFLLAEWDESVVDLERQYGIRR